MVWMVESRGQRSAEPQMLGGLRHDRQNSQRVEVGELPAMLKVGAGAAFIDVGDALRIGIEAAIEAGILQHAGDMRIATWVEDVAQGRVRMPPAAGVHGAGAR